MTAARTFKIATPLARQLSRTGGRTVAEAQRRAEAGLDAHRETTLADVGRLIGELEIFCEAGGPDNAARIYERAATLIDLAGFFDTGPLYDAGYSLCELCDRMRASDNWNWPAVDVHVKALRLIHAGGCRTDDEAAALLKGLGGVLLAAGAAISQ